MQALVIHVAAQAVLGFPLGEQLIPCCGSRIVARVVVELDTMAAEVASEVPTWAFVSRFSAGASRIYRMENV